MADARVSVLVQIRSRLAELDRATAGFQTLVRRILAATAAYVSLSSVVRGSRDILGFGADLEQVSTRTGVAVADLATLRQAFADNGVEPQRAGKAINDMQRRIADAARGIGTGRQALRTNPRRFEEYPHKFLIGIYRGKSGHIAKTAQLRALAPYWLGRMLSWEWMAHRAELFGLPIRWANYPADLDDNEVQRLAGMIENMGSAAWAVFPAGVDLKLQSGAISGVAGGNEPTERLMNMADRACDLIFIGQTLTSQSDGVGSYAMARVHRDVELDHYESYANYVAKVFNTQLLPSIIELNWGSAHEVPEFQFNLPLTDAENDKVRRDKVLFKDMGLPVSRAWLYNRHRVPPPAPDDPLFQGEAPDISAPFGEEAAAHAPTATPSASPGGSPSGLGAGLETASPAGGGGQHSAPPPNGGTEAKGAAPCGCAAPVDARSESNAELEERKAAARHQLEALKARAAAEGKTIYWDNPMDERTSEECMRRHGKAYGDGWTNPPPIHHNCRSTLVLR